MTVEREAIIELLLPTMHINQAEQVADKIVQCPDLQVSIVPKRYYVQQRGMDNWFCVIDRNQMEDLPARLYHLAHFRLRSHADDYVSWLNSGEQKWGGPNYGKS